MSVSEHEQATRLDRRMACDRAGLARDRRFDGLFFTGVRTTRIDCRLVCPVRPAKSANVFFFPTAATTVARGLRLIDAGFLDHRSVDALAAVLGIGPRHLLRLFLRHAGAMRSEVAATCRIQRAKRLLDDTTLRLSDIAFASGFGSIRRFNAAFRGVYGRPPSAFRRRGGEARAVRSARLAS